MEQIGQKLRQMGTYVVSNWSSFHSIGGGGGTVNDGHVYGSSIHGAPYRQLNSLLYDGTSLVSRCCFEYCS